MGPENQNALAAAAPAPGYTAPAFAPYKSRGMNFLARLASPEAYRAGMRERATLAAGEALSTGDYAAAQKALYGVGELDAGLGLQKQIDATAEREHEDLLAGMVALRSIPSDQRRMALQNPQIAELLKKHGQDPATIGDDHLSDTYLDAGIAGLSPKEATQAYYKAREPRNSPAGYQWSAEDPNALQYIPGGPYDPNTVNMLTTTRRKVIVSNPLPSRARGKTASSGGSGGAPKKGMVRLGPPPS